MQRVATSASIAFLFFPLTLPPAGRAEHTCAELERKRAAVERGNDDLQKEFEQAVDQILNGGVYIEGKRKVLENEVKNWNEDGAGTSGGDDTVAERRQETRDAELKAYLSANRKIQSAEVDSLESDLENLTGKQHLAGKQPQRAVTTRREAVP